MTPFGKAVAAFGRKPGEVEGKSPPTAHVFRAAARRQAMIARAREALVTLPEPGESIHCLQTGYFDLLMIVAVLISHYGKAPSIRLATSARSVV